MVETMFSNLFNKMIDIVVVCDWKCILLYDLTLIHWPEKNPGILRPGGRLLYSRERDRSAWPAATEIDYEWLCGSSRVDGDGNTPVGWATQSIKTRSGQLRRGWDGWCSRCLRQNPKLVKQPAWRFNKYLIGAVFFGLISFLLILTISRAFYQ